MPKPNDFYVTVIDFFGILVPGALLTFFHRDFLTKMFSLELGTDTAAAWAAFLVASYIGGQLLLGVGVPLNGLLQIVAPEAKDAFFQTVQRRVEIIQGVSDTRTRVFYQVYAELRLCSPQALAEIERNMADYKLFRSLTLVFTLQLANSLTTANSWSDMKVWLCLVLLVLTLGRFLFLLGWTYRRAFAYLVLLEATKEVTAKDIVAA